MNVLVDVLQKKTKKITNLFSNRFYNCVTILARVWQEFASFLLLLNCCNLHINNASRAKMCIRSAPDLNWYKFVIKLRNYILYVLTSGIWCLRPECISTNWALCSDFEEELTWGTCTIRGLFLCSWNKSKWFVSYFSLMGSENLSQDWIHHHMDGQFISAQSGKTRYSSCLYIWRLMSYNSYN